MGPSPEDMAKYSNWYFNQYVQEQDLKESILTGSPRIMSHLPIFGMNLRHNISKNQKRNIDVIGPLSWLRYSLESASTAPDDKTDLTIEDLLNSLQQIVLLVGQTNNTT